MLQKWRKVMEKYLKTDVAYVAKGGFWLASGETVVSILTFISAVAFANFISKETYGSYKYILSVFGFLGVFTLRGVDPLVTQAAAEGLDGSLRQALRVKTKFGLAGSLGSILIAIYFLYTGNRSIALGFLIASAFVPLSFGIYINYLKGKKLFRVSTKYTTITHAFTTLSMIATVLLVDNLLLILFVGLFTLALAQAFFYFQTLKRYVSNDERSPKMRGHGSHMSLVNFVDSVFGSVDDILLFHFLGPVGVAVYSVAIAPVQHLRKVSNYVTELTTPKLARRTVEEIDRHFWFRTVLLTAIGLVLFGLYYVTIPYFFTWFFPKYMESVPYSQLFALVVPLGLAQSILAAALGGKLMHIEKKLFYLWLIPGMSATAFIFLFVERYGIYAVIWARILAVAAAIPVSFLIWRKFKKRESTSHAPKTQ